MSISNLQALVESILFSSEHPLDAGEILRIIQKAEGIEVADPTVSVSPEEENRLKTEAIPEQSSDADQTRALSRLEILGELQRLKIEYESSPVRGFFLQEVAGGFQFRTRAEFAPYLRAMHQTTPGRLSQPALETLAMVAYRQPIIRAEIDELRGVDSGGVLKTLLDRDLIRVVGKKEEPGKPLLYGTTEQFLKVFGLNDLQQLPTLKDLRQIEEEMNSSVKGEAALPLSEDFFDLKHQESDQLQEIHANFQQMQEQEEHALKELEQQLVSLEGLEKQVMQTFFPAEAPAEPPKEAPLMQPLTEAPLESAVERV